MGAYQKISATVKKPSKELLEINRQRRIQWRKEGSSVRVERPTNLARARALGYKPKSGVVIVRQRVPRGGRKRPDIKGGRRSKNAHQIKILDMNYRGVAEIRASQKYPNMEVLNSYTVGKDGHSYWYEVILVDRDSPEVLADKNMVGIAINKGRAFRGMTSAGKKSRGLRNKGKGAEKVRSSRTAVHRRKVRKFRKSYGF